MLVRSVAHKDPSLLLRRRFAEVVFSVYEAGDVVWVQDYHLMLLPALLKKQKPKMKARFNISPLRRWRS